MCHENTHKEAMLPHRSFTALQYQDLDECKHSPRFNGSHSLGGSRLDRLSSIEINGSFASPLFGAKNFSSYLFFREGLGVLI